MAYNLIVADSSPTLKKICQSIFSEGSYNLFFASTQEELNQLLDKMVPEALILSASLFDSLEGFLQINNRLLAIGRVPVFLIGGTFETLSEEYTQILKAEKIFIKPFYSESLAEAVKEAIEKRRVPDTMPEELPEDTPTGFNSTSTNLSPALLREIRLAVQQEVLETERELEKRLRSSLLYEVKNIFKEKTEIQETGSDHERKKG
ncbi:MAG: hypothetical protein ACPLZD_05610 [Candidatus Saccharicenans sp.]|nr:MAG: hypothetical protein C0168_00615 [Candidatus Aminicenantes bacterium]HEK84799.1 hypothetical protein [Candidatus Aminicenantes bacterium]